MAPNLKVQVSSRDLGSIRLGTVREQILLHRSFVRVCLTRILRFCIGRSGKDERYSQLAHLTHLNPCPYFLQLNSESKDKPHVKRHKVSSLRKRVYPSFRARAQFISHSQHTHTHTCVKIVSEPRKWVISPWFPIKPSSTHPKEGPSMQAPCYPSKLRAALQRCSSALRLRFSRKWSPWEGFIGSIWGVRSQCGREALTWNMGCGVLVGPDFGVVCQRHVHVGWQIKPDSIRPDSSWISTLDIHYELRTSA